MAVALQNVVVTLVAIGAAGYFVRRIFGHPPAQAAAGAPPCVGCQLHASVPKSRARTEEKLAPAR